MTKSPTKRTVWLIEDHADFRELIGWQINEIDGFACTGLYPSCEKAIAALGKEPVPDVILCDIGLPGMDGISGIRKIKSMAPAPHVVVLTVYDDAEKVFNALCAGATGYLLKNASEERLAEALHDVLNGGSPMHPRVARLALNMLTRQARSAGAANYRLTPRETEVLELMVNGLTSKEIGAKLKVSYHTVNNQLRSIYEKLHVHTRGGAVAKALKERLF
jgi:DNA-binding NarL/FixJ family response regulator